MSLLIRGGRVITAVDDFIGDVLVKDDRVAAVGTALEVEADTVVDADGKYVLPGCVDPHTHMSMPAGPTTTIDDFTTGTRSAAAGGTTTIIDFCVQEHGQRLTDALDVWHAKLDSARPLADVGFHMVVADLDVPHAENDLASMPRLGITSFKCFMAYKGSLMVDDETLFTVMQVAAANDVLVMVHAENGGVIDVLVRQALEGGHTDPSWHARTRPMATEAEATARAIYLADLAGCALFVVHVSCLAALEPVAAARSRTARVWAETCSHYLFITHEDLARPGFEGGKYVFTPPARPADQHAHLWRALLGGGLDLVSSDHCAFNWNDQKSLGRGDFSKIPNGAPGIEHRLALLHHYGVRERGMSLNRLVELTATAPAQLFGLFPRKGTIAAGSDADLVVFAPDVRHTLSVNTHHSAADYCLYEGIRVCGAVEQVFLRGQQVVVDGHPVKDVGPGRFLPRARFAH